MLSQTIIWTIIHGRRNCVACAMALLYVHHAGHGAPLHKQRHGDAH